MTDVNGENAEKPSEAQIGKDALQSTLEAATAAAGQVATILGVAVRDLATAVGNFATEVVEIREASRKATEDGQGRSAAD